MAKNTGKYREVQELPINALTVQCYADKHGWKAHNIYMRLNRGTNNFEIIVFQGINFVIPLSEKQSVNQ